MGGGCELRENENESEDTSSSVWKSEHTSSCSFLHIIYIFLYFRKSPLKFSILPEKHLKAISIFYTVRGGRKGEKKREPFIR